MLIKWIGIFLLAAATLYIALDLARSCRQRTRQTEAILLLIRHVRAKISCFSTPVGEILADFENEVLERSGILPSARENGLAAAVRAASERGCISRAQADMLSDMWGQLGGGYREEAVKICDYYISEFESTLSHEREEHPRMARLLRGVVLTGGAMLIIVLI